MKSNGSFEKDWESNGESNMSYKTDGEKEDRGPNGDNGIEGNSCSDGKGEFSEMVWACVEEGWLTCFEKSVGVWSEGQEEVRITEEGVEDKKSQVEKESKSVDLEKEDALNRARWRVGVGEIAVRLG